MCWSPATAGVMLRVRAIYLSGDWAEGWELQMTRDQDQLNRTLSWRVEEK